MTTRAVSQQELFDRLPSGTLASRAPALADLAAVPGFIQLSISNGLSQSFGQRIQAIAIAWLVLEMTGSVFWLGVVIGAPAISTVLFSLAGGVMADSLDARRVLLISRSALTATTLILAVVVTSGSVTLSHLVVYVLLISGIAAIDMPVARHLVHDMVGSPRLMSASATQSIFTNVVNIVAPVSMGILIAAGGPAAAFWLLGGGYAVAVLMIRLTRRGSGPRQHKRVNPLADILAGLAYIRRTPEVAVLVSLAFLVPVAGIYFAMVPVYARSVLHVGPDGLGVLVASFSVGSLAGSIYLAANGQPDKPAHSLALFGAAFGVGMMAFALSQSFVLSCAISLAMGVAAGFWQNMLNAMVQVVAAPEMRGRVTSVLTMGFQLMGLGWLFGGFLGSTAGLAPTVLGGGLVFFSLSLAAFALSRDVRAIN